MKIQLKTIVNSFFLSMILLFTACDTEESLHITQPEAAFTLNDPSATNIFLNFSLPENPAFTITWVDEITGSSNYTVEMATDAEFTEPFTLGTTSSKSFTMNVVDFNEILSSAEVESFSNAAIYMRVLAGSNISNAIIFTVNSYPENNPTIVSPDSSFSVVLSQDTPDDNALTIEWEDSDFSEESTIPVNYTIEAAITGTDFEPLTSFGSTTDTSYSFTHDALNTYVLNMGLLANEVGNIDIRIKSVVETTSGTIERLSQVIQISVTPYGYNALYLVGSLTNWSPAEALPFTKTDLNKFELIVDLPDGAAFKFIPTNTSWDGALKEDPNSPGTLIDEPGDPNISGYAAGEYIIKVDLNTFTFTIELTSYPNLYLVGDATSAGWNPGNNNYPMFKDPDQGGLYHYTGFFKAGSVKLIETKGQWAPMYGTNDGTTLVYRPTESDPDPGVISIPSDGYYSLTVNLVDLTFSVTPYDASGATVYATMGVIGRATPTAWDSQTEMTQSTFDPHIWYLTLDMNQSDGGDCDCGFKFRVDGTWNPNWGGEQNPPTLNYGVAELSGKNIGVPETGTYTIFFNTLDFRYYYIIE